ncbi:MAG: 5-(carboxyamino)imidazole ribonucleotide synthase [Rickettsiales bacterium]|nr:5-(carboxyamino)imidazole ribonucleotide synthase [Rickettsiales bacterium]
MVGLDSSKIVIGILGGGQLAQMTITSAHNMGYKVHVYSDSEDSIAFRKSDYKTCASYNDQVAIDKFAGAVDLITYEFENIPSSIVTYLEKNFKLMPNALALEICQKRNLEKQFVNDLGIKTAKFQIVENINDVESFFAKNGSAILKTNSLGYDGKGQYVLNNLADIKKVEEIDFANTDFIIEEKLDFNFEISVLIARNENNQTSIMPITRNIHKNGILNRTFYPAGIKEEVIKNAEQIALKIANKFNFVGILAIEMFVMLNHDIVVNEMAPRPHNTGHWSIDACDYSQFDLFVKAITNQKLPNVSVKYNAEMVNLIGDEINQVDYLAKDSNIFIHNYGKSEVKPGRKMGHYTVLEK